MSAILGLETFYLKRMINDYIYLQYGRIINVMKICLISAHLTMASLIPVAGRTVSMMTLPTMIN